MHTEAKQISLNSFAKLASSVLYQASETNVTMKQYRQYRQGKPTPGGIPTRKVKRTGLEILTADQKEILECYGLISTIIDKTLRVKKTSRSLSASSEAD